MYYSRTRETMRRSAATALALCLAAISETVDAAPEWTRANGPMADSIALFHFDENCSVPLLATPRTGVPAGTQVTHLLNHSALDSNQGLEHWNFNAPDVGSMEFSHDVSALALGGSSLALTGPVRVRSSQIYLDANQNDLTIEAWVKWDDSNTSCDLRLGTGDRLLRIVRDTANPANDALGFQGTHGQWRPSPGFTGFANLPDPVSDGQWFHIAMSIHNTGMHAHDGHWFYDDDSFAMVFVNGHLVGAGTTNDRIALHDHDLVFHGSDRLALWNFAGESRVLIDEFTTLQRDVTNGGVDTVSLFNDGRGAGNASAEAWMLYE